MQLKQFVQAGFIVALLGVGAAGAIAAPAAAPNTTNGKPAPAAVDTSGPSELIETSANVILSGIDAHRDEYRKDPTGLYDLVEKTLLPNFDTPYAAQLVLVEVIGGDRSGAQGADGTAVMQVSG